LKTSEKSNIFVEVKCGDTYNGKLELIDKFMNIKMGEVIQTSKVINISKNFLRMETNSIRSKSCSLKEAT
jgi:small nuclear ribonucleoprotein (snRNP)-like protein